MGLDVTELAPKLWIGSAPPVGSALSESGFEALALCADRWQPSQAMFPQVEVLNAPFRDAEDVTKAELGEAVRAASWATKKLKEGKKTLVTCMAGRNRSGLVCAMTLSMATGADPAKCGEHVRARRGAIALENAKFVDVLNAAHRHRCELCQAKRITPRFFEEPLCWLGICKTCLVPIAVLRRHSTSPTTEERQRMLGMLEMLAYQLSPEVTWKIDTERRSIPDHWHAHARPAR